MDLVVGVGLGALMAFLPFALACFTVAEDRDELWGWLAQGGRAAVFLAISAVLVASLASREGSGFVAQTLRDAVAAAR